MTASDRQVTREFGGRILTNFGVWSPDGEWIVYDTRSDAAGEVFDGSSIEMVNIRTGEVRQIYRSSHRAHCGVVTFHPHEWKAVFILGPENPTPDWSYNACHRRGVIVDLTGFGLSSTPLAESPHPSGHPADELRSQASRQPPVFNLDARDLTPPFTPGALRGGSHVHVWNAAGEWVSFTYEDHVLAQFKQASAANDVNQRNIGVSIPAPAVRVNKDHVRNHDGQFFTVLVTRTVAKPTPGSDEISRAFEEGWVGNRGYARGDGSRQRHALAFQGLVVTAKGETISEVFIADLPDELTKPGDGPLAGTETRRPAPPKGVTQRRLTDTAGRKFPGIQGPRHWLRSSPDGQRIAFLMKDDAGIVQLWTVSPNGGPAEQLTRNPSPIASAFTWSPDGRFIAHVMEGSVCLTDTASGDTHRLTPRSAAAIAPRPEACVFSPDGRKIAFVRRLRTQGVESNQIWVVSIGPEMGAGDSAR